MLFIQFITLRWQKDVRDSVHAAARRAVRFWLLPQEKPKADTVLLHSVMLRQDQAGIACVGETVRPFGAEILSDAPLRELPYPARLQITESDGTFRVAYCGKDSDGLFSEKCAFCPVNPAGSYTISAGLTVYGHLVLRSDGLQFCQCAVQ